ncbi:ATP-binding cassette domain-containing protein [Saccharothrix algeriensis]|uniref:Energy-coupling factor transporter ATP-binding protein EcfA2 n=1 Tax=Saccharothrix algeriensis TaxID=173560 RepID=A0ABS2SFB6_9PSEU|nr:ABC transporter ATP-binding protein [Saccharothrix algeriensis]MBM7813746.1 energy-coupling factor transporter ATP-binding protein EcfA2 [Saccharothrix algeriensis]
MEIHAQRVGATGPHGPLLKPTSLRVPAGEAVLVAGPPGAGHTAFALLLSGRLRPGAGTVTPNAAELRKHVVLVDSPEVNEPEGSMPLAAVVGEELAMNGRRAGRKAVADWLVERGAEEFADARFDQVPAESRCSLMLELAAGRPGARVLVLDSPDRYHGDPAGWWAAARRRVTPHLSVVVLCTTTSAAVLDVPAARLGADNVVPVDVPTGPLDTARLTAAGAGRPAGATAAPRRADRPVELPVELPAAAAPRHADRATDRTAGHAADRTAERATDRPVDRTVELPAAAREPEETS